MQFEQVACDLCGGTEVDRVVAMRDPDNIAPGEFTVVMCKHCHLQYINPRPDKLSIGQCYPGNYYAFSSMQKNVHASTLRKRIKRVIRSNKMLAAIAARLPALRSAAIDLPFAADFDYWMPCGAILEVGCGSGGLLDIMRNNGWRTYGIEPSNDAAALAQASGHQVFVMGGDDAYPDELSRLQFDLIYLSHSLEHMHYPTKSLSNLARLLKPVSGRMVIEVPNAESLLTYLFGELTPIYDVPRHLYFYSPDTLAAMLKKTGYRIESMRLFSRPNQFVRCFRAGIGRIPFEPWRLKANQVMGSAEFLAAMEPLSNYAERLKLGASIRVVVSRTD